MENALILSKTLWKQLLFIVIFLSIINLRGAMAQPDCDWVDGRGTDGTPNEPVSCAGAITEDFNQGNGGFTSDAFVWDASEGYWIAKKGRPNSSTTYSITSGIYELNQDGYVEYGFIYSGANEFQITIIDAETCEVLADGCRSIGMRYGEQSGYYIVCFRLPSPGTNEELYEGRKIQFVTTFSTNRFAGYRSGRYIIYDNFSVSGTATAVSDPSTSTCSASSASLSGERSASQEKENFTLFPNPVSQQTTLSFDELPENATLYLRRADGYLLREYNLKKGAVSTLLDLSTEKPGMYIITLEGGSGRRIVRKLFKYD